MPTDRWWWSRKTLKEFTQEVRENETLGLNDVDEARLSENEYLNLATVTTVEIFTPSTVEKLLESIYRLPIGDHSKSEARRHIYESRQNNRSVGPFPLCTGVGADAPEYYLALNDSFRDSSLPDGVEQVKVVAHSLTPSVVVITCTFRLYATAGNLSGIQQSAQTGLLTDLEVMPDGRFASLRSRLGWTRPKSYRVRVSGRNARNARDTACQDVIRNLEQACHSWSRFRFPGPVGEIPFLDQPFGRTFVLGNFDWTEAPKLPHEVGVWDWTGMRVTEVWGTEHRLQWLIATSGFRERVNTVTAFRRIDLQDGPLNDPYLRSALTNFSEKFDDYMARWGLIQALALFRRQLIQTRDASFLTVDALERAQNISHYLSSGGADAEIIATDIVSTGDLPLFFELDQCRLDEEGRISSTAWPIHTATQQIIRRNAQQLLTEHKTTVSLLTSHSQLLLASENAKLQNRLSWYTRLAFLIAIASLIVALLQLFQDKATSLQGDQRDHSSTGQPSPNSGLR